MLKPKLKNSYHRVFSDLFTRLEFEPRWIINSLSQLVRLGEAYPVRYLFETAKGCTALLVSTGPSLRSSLTWIKKNQNNLFITCVDSAYRVLHRSGIKPHLIFSLDSQPFTLRHFLGLPMGEKNTFPILYADLVANPQVTMRWRGPIVYGTTAQYNNTTRNVTPGSDFVEENILKRDNNDYHLGDIQSGGSVATSLFDLLRQMQFSKILLLGQDLAYSHREIHVSGTHHSDIWFSGTACRTSPIETINERVIRKRHTIAEHSISGGPIRADYVLSLYRNWFSQAAERINIPVYNGTSEGLAIRNTLPVNLEYETTDLKNLQLSCPDQLKLLIEKIKQIYLKKKVISDDKLVNEWMRRIHDTDYSEEVEKGFQFMSRIGRKHIILSNRKGESHDSTVFVEKARNEKKVFWVKLQKYCQVWKGLL